MINKIFLLFCIFLIYCATLLPKNTIYYSTFGKVIKTQIIEKVEEVPVKKVIINTDNVSSTVDTKKAFRRFRLIVHYEYKCHRTNKSFTGIHKFGEFPQYLTELELVNIKRKYYKGSTIPIFVNRLNKNKSTLISPTNYPRIILASIGLSLILFHVYLALLKIRDANFPFENRKLAPILQF